MLNFGRTPERRVPGATAFGDHLSNDPSLMQLLPLEALRREASDTGLCAHRLRSSGAAARARAFLRQSALLQEVGRRTGDGEVLARAATAAGQARALAKNERRLTAEALLRHAEILALAGALFSDAEAGQAAGRRLEEVAPGALDPVGAARAEALKAALLARRAHGLGTAAADQAAAAALAPAARALSRLADLGRVDASEGLEVRADLCELLMVAANRSKDRSKLEEAVEALRQAAERLEAERRPLTWCRIEVLRGQALAALGDLAGEAAFIAEGAKALQAVVSQIGMGDSPLDAVRAGHALGLVLQSLGEACDEEDRFDEALDAFAPAMLALEATPELPLRAIVAHDAAACLARRAERRGDVRALAQAEQRFREALTCKTAAADPLSWAVTQVALARIYEAEADLRGDADAPGRDAAFALASALEIFAERGLRTLSDAALSALARVKAPA